MLNSRLYNMNDRERIEKICLNNAECQTAPRSACKAVLLMNCDYYVEQEPENCFVAVSDAGDVVGYILCSENADRYETIFKDNYLDGFYKLGNDKFVAARLAMLSQTMFKSSFPAHIKLGVDEKYRRLGFGTLLVNNMKAHLLKKGITSMLAVCGKHDAVAIDFFLSCGFKKLVDTRLGVVMLLEFGEKNEPANDEEAYMNYDNTTTADVEES